MGGHRAGPRVRQPDLDISACSLRPVTLAAGQKRRSWAFTLWRVRRRKKHNVHLSCRVQFGKLPGEKGLRIEREDGKGGGKEGRKDSLLRSVSI